MKCRSCHRNIRPGLEATKRVEYWRQPDNSIKVFSDVVPDVDGKLSQVTGKLVEAQHAKHYWAERKRTERAGQAADAASHEGNGNHRGAAA